MMKRARAALNEHTSRFRSGAARQGRELTFPRQVLNYILATLLTNYLFSEGDVDKMSFKQPEGERTVEYVQTIWTKALPCESI